MTLPYAGRPGVFDLFSPTLLPNFNRPFITNGVLGYQSPAEFVQNNPRTPAQVEAAIGGTITAGNTVTLTLTQGQLPNGAISVTYTVASGDSDGIVAESLAALLGAALYAAGIPAYVTVSEATLTVNWEGPLGNYATLSYTLSSGATETVTLTPSSGVLSGGAGPVFCSNNFNYSYNNSTMSFFYGEPYVLGDDLLSQLVTQNMPVV